MPRLTAMLDLAVLARLPVAIDTLLACVQTQAAVAALAAQAKKGIVCVRASRVAVGRVERNVEVDDDKLGFVASLDKNPQKARVLLRLALLKTHDVKDIQRMFGEY